jgi:hypothetical protein
MRATALFIFKITYRLNFEQEQEGSSANASNLYSGGTCFESRQQQLRSLRFSWLSKNYNCAAVFVVFLSSFKWMMKYDVEKAITSPLHLLSNLLLHRHPAASPHYTEQDTHSVVQQTISFFSDSQRHNVTATFGPMQTQIFLIKFTAEIVSTHNFMHPVTNVTTARNKTICDVITSSVTRNYNCRLIAGHYTSRTNWEMRISWGVMCLHNNHINFVFWYITP